MIVNRDIALVLDREQSIGDTHVFKITNESIDSHRTVFRSEGWDFEPYKRNPIVTYGHPDMNSTDDRDVIGKSEVFQVGSETFARVTYDMEDSKAKRIKSKVERGFLNCCSIRAQVHEGDFGDAARGEDPEVLYFSRQTLLDWGIVMHPSNKDAQRVEEVARALNIEPRVKEDDPAPEVDQELIERAKKILNK